jgi:hypothetical protein
MILRKRASQFKFMAMTTLKAEEDLVGGYRSAAEECQQQAARSAIGLQRDYWPKVAGEWITLAGQAGRSSR